MCFRKVGENHGGKSGGIVCGLPMNQEPSIRLLLVQVYWEGAVLKVIVGDLGSETGIK